MPKKHSEIGSFLGKRILVFTAHPDDEMIVAGTMFENHRAGGETFLICATYGEKGKSHLKKPVSDAALAKIRKTELLAAAKTLKIDDVIFLGLPDAGVREESKKLYEKSLPIIKKLKPDYILSFGPDGMSGHWDHITVGSVALRIAKKLKIPIAAFTISPVFQKMPLTKNVSAPAQIWKIQRRHARASRRQRENQDRRECETAGDEVSQISVRRRQFPR